MSRSLMASRVWGEISALLQWWREQLVELGLAVLARTIPRLATRIQVFPNAAEWQIWLVRGTRRQPLTTIAAPPTPLNEEQQRALQPIAKAPALIGVAPSSLMTLDCRLPAAAERALHSAIPLYLQRELPLPLEQFHVQWRLIARDRLTRQITVRIWIIRARDAQLYLDAVRGFGLRAVQLGIDQGNGHIAHNFMRAQGSEVRAQEQLPTRRLAMAAGALLMAIVLLTAGQWSYERVRVGRVQRALHARALIVRAQSEQLVHAWQPALAIREVMADVDAADTLLALTQAIPTSAWVYDANIEALTHAPAHIKIMGFAPQANGLTQTLEALSGFRAVTLVNSLPSSVGSSGNASGERFQIAADWAPVESAPGGVARAQDRNVAGL